MKFKITSRRVTSLMGLIVVSAGIVHCAGVGAGAAGPRLARMQQSKQWDKNVFKNPQEVITDNWAAMKTMFTPDDNVAPHDPVPVTAMTTSQFDAAPASGLRVTWMGHSSILLEIDGARVLMDPMWSERVGPVPWAGPKRWFAPPIALSDLPALDAVVISHDHYDHLDRDTVVGLNALHVPFVVPLGVGARLASWGIEDASITELDWWEKTQVGHGLQIVCTPARHASGRILWDRDTTLWGSFSFIGAPHRVFYSGDTGLFPGLRDIGAQLGPFDLTLLEIGQYNAAWPDWHSGPEQAVKAHQMLNGRVALPVHWALFALAAHGWTEPIERFIAAAQDAAVRFVVPRPGQSIEPSDAPPLTRWWPTLPYKTAAQDPIVSSQVDTTGLQNRVR